MIRQMTSAVSPRLLILLSSPIWGLIYGTATGLLTLLLALFIKPGKIGERSSRPIDQV
jgi:hypothetical protein